MANVLVVDDEENIRDYIAETMELDGHNVMEAANGLDALELLRRHPVDLMITDIKMPGMDGIELVGSASENYPNMFCIVMTAHGTIPSAVEAMKTGAIDYLQKPVKIKTLRELTRRILAQKKPVKTKRPKGHRILSWGAKEMKPPLRALERVATTSATVLLLGESGVGKEVFAQTIHERSPRKDEPFMAVNCAAIAESLIESELFGHEKGAFTSADKKRIGAIEAADGGTVFLDEIGELKLESQAKLLRVLEDKTFQRVGSSKEIKVDVRWVAATNRDLKQMVKEGTFRRDLYHRLATFPITIPSLRARRADIEPMAKSLLDELTRDENLSGIELADDAIQWLKNQPWPGNVRELKNTLKRTVIMAQSAVLSADDFKFTKQVEYFDEDDVDETQTHYDAIGEDAVPLETLDLSILEEKAIRTALEQHNNNKRLAAETLGIPVRTLYNKLKKLGLDG